MVRRNNTLMKALVLGPLALVIFAICFPVVTVHAADIVQQPYTLLAPLPLDNPSGPDVTTTTASSYITGIVKLVIAVAGGLAVLRITFSGFQYISTDSFNGKDSAKQGIQESLLGLLLIIGAYTILYTINPQLVAFNLRIAGQDTGSALGLNVGDQPGNPADVGVCNGNAGSTCVKTQGYSFPQKGPGSGGGCSGDVCYIAQPLAEKLVTLNKSLNDVGITKNDWIVTEMDPPKDPDHVSSCHLDGTCVDAKLTATNPDAKAVATFLQQITDKVGPSFLYEPADCTRYKTLISSPALAAFKPQIKVCNSTSGENVHINLTGGTGGSCGQTNVNGVATSNEKTCS